MGDGVCHQEARGDQHGREEGPLAGAQAHDDADGREQTEDPGQNGEGPRETLGAEPGGAAGLEPGLDDLLVRGLHVAEDPQEDGVRVEEERAERPRDVAQVDLRPAPQVGEGLVTVRTLELGVEPHPGEQVVVGLTRNLALHP